MWDKFLDYGQRTTNVSRRVDRHDEQLTEIREDIKALQSDFRDMGDAIRYVNDRQERDRDRDAARDENIVLRLEVTLLRAGVGALSPAPPTIAPDAPPQPGD